MNASSRWGTSQPPAAKPSLVSSSGDPGPWLTPSREMNCIRINFIQVIYNQMVVYGSEQENVDRVFHALADATRRDILARTLEGERSISALAELYPMSFAAVQKHVAVLEQAALVTKRRLGRERLVAANAATLRDAAQLLGRLESAWRERIDRFGTVFDEDVVG